MHRSRPSKFVLTITPTLTLTLALALALALALLGACSDTPAPLTPDAAAPDSGAQQDGAVVSDTKPTPDSAPQPDAATSGTLTVTYTLMSAGGKLGCAGGQAKWVDVVLLANKKIVASKEDQPCDDKPVSFDLLPFGSYVVSVTAWDLQLWDGSVDDHVFDATAGQTVEVPLTLIPAP